MDEPTMWAKIAGAATGLVGVIGGWVWKDHNERLQCLTRKVNSFPVDFISKSDCAKLHTENSDATKALLTRMDIGFDRVFTKIDAVHKDHQERHDKLRDLIEERTRK